MGPRTDTATAEARHSWRRLGPQGWGIATRSAVVSAIVVLIALVLAGLGLLAILQGSLTSAVDDATRIRAAEIATALQSERPGELDDNLLATNQRIADIQVLDDHGTVVHSSSGAPATPMINAPKPVAGVTDTALHAGKRITRQVVTTPAGSYTVLVAGGTEAVESSVRTVAGLLLIATPLVMAETAFVSYLMTKRSLRSVDTIRGRVAEISASDLSERVPVPPTRDEIASLATTMNDMLERIDRSHSAQRQFVGDASHELRSPLTTLISTLEVVDAHPHLLDAELVTDTLLPEALRMRDLVEDLLLLARADERALRPRRDVVRLDEIVDAESARLRHNTGLEVNADTDTPAIVGDPPAVARVLRNLCDNAARHAHSQIDIATHTHNGTAVLIVGDDGPGIPAADRSRVFDRFVRLDADRSRRSGGTGLGLAIVAEIVAAHQGTVSVDDRPGGGAQVTVTLPQQP